MRITKNELMTMAQSGNADDRKRAFRIYQAWLRMNKDLPPQDQINATERHLFTQAFALQKMSVDRRGPERR